MNRYVITIVLCFLSIGLVLHAHAGQPPDISIYKEHKVIYVSGGSQEVFNYPLKLDLGRGGLNLPYPGSLKDIYFTSGDGKNPLYYYLENPSNCYIKVPRIPREGTTVHIYYNKRKLLPQETAFETDEYLDPDKVFPFFEDFSGAALNEEKWEVMLGLKKEYSIKDGYLQLKDGLIISRNFKIKQGIIEFKAKAEENAAIQVALRSGVFGPATFPYEQLVYSSNYPGVEHTIAINDIAKLNIGKPIQPFIFYIYKVTVDPKSIIFERYSENQQEKQAQIQFLDMGNSDEGRIGLKANALPFNNSGSVYFDWIRVRPYVEVEPASKVMK